MHQLTDQEIAQQVKLHTPLVHTLARTLVRRLPASVDCADLIQDGQVALISAILSTSKKITAAHFKNYVTLRIKGAMLDGLRELDQGSRHLRKDMRAVELMIQKLGHELGRMPFESEVAQAMGLPVRKYQRMLQDAADYTVISLDDIVELDQSALLPACHEDADPLGVLERSALRESLLHAVGTLSAQHSTVLRHYYVDEWKMHQIGKKLKLTEARVSQIHAQAIAELRSRLVDDSGSMPVLQPRRSTRAKPPAAAATPAELQA